MRLLKGKDTIKYYLFKDEEIKAGYPNPNVIVGSIFRVVAIPNINPHQVMKTTHAIVKEFKKLFMGNHSPGAPFPYIPNPPKPPDDLDEAAQVQVQRMNPPEESEMTRYCKHCGAPLYEGVSVCPNCKKVN